MVKIRYQRIEYNKRQAQRAIIEGKKRHESLTPSVKEAAVIAGEFIARRNNGHGSKYELKDIAKHYRPKFLEDREI